LGGTIHRLTGPPGLLTIMLAVLLIVVGLVLLLRNEQRLEELAEQVLPGSPLDIYDRALVHHVSGHQALNLVLAGQCSVSRRTARPTHIHKWRKIHAALEFFCCGYPGSS
jgi:predicted PurR-regulated permease PerM